MTPCAALRVSRTVIFPTQRARPLRSRTQCARRHPARNGAETRDRHGLFSAGFVTNSARDAFRAAPEERKRPATLYPPDPDRAAAEMQQWRQTHQDKTPPTVSDVADHVDHLRQVMGIDHIGLGSDFDGFNGAVRGLEDVSKFPVLLAELARRGYSREDLEKIAGLNLLRVMREVETVAREWAPRPLRKSTWRGG